MCSRYELNASARDVMERFGLKAPPALPNAAEFRPTDTALVIVAAGDGAAPQTRLLGWGLPASWDGRALINARAETLDRKKTFLPLLKHRCLVPAHAYFEWRRDGRRTLKNRIAPKAGGIMAFAGLTDGETFTIVTCRPAPAIAHIHDRMPVILERSREGPWLDPARPYPDVAGVLKPYQVGALSAAEDAPPDAQPDLFA